MHSFNKLLKFSTQNKKNAKVTFYGTLILLYIYKTNTIIIREMLTSALRAFVNNPVKENFYGKKKNN